MYAIRSYYVTYPTEDEDSVIETYYIRKDSVVKGDETDEVN